MNHKESNKLYRCPVCKLHYPTKELAQSCEVWCTEHHSCNMDIIRHAVPAPEDADE